ncbi:hypothetical protein ACWEQP_35020 [Streptomyces sp. NPDC004044]
MEPVGRWIQARHETRAAAVADGSRTGQLEHSQANYDAQSLSGVIKA